MKANDLISALGLSPHPEGGAFRETYRAASRVGDRATATAIYFLLAAKERSAWHRVKHDELWLYHGGDPLRLRRIDAAGQLHEETLALPPAGLPQRLIPAGEWQSAAPLSGADNWTLVGCVVSPGFDFADFEMATDEALSALYPALTTRLVSRD